MLRPWPAFLRTSKAFFLSQRPALLSFSTRIMSGGYQRSSYSSERSGYNGGDRGGNKYDMLQRTSSTSTFDERGGSGFSGRGGYGQQGGRGGYGSSSSNQGSRYQQDRGFGQQRDNDRARSPQRENGYPTDQALMRKAVDTLGVDASSLPPIKKRLLEEHGEITAMSEAEITKFREEAQMTIKGKDIPKPIIDFHQAGFSSAIERKLGEMGFEKPTAIQAQGWAMALMGHNMVGIAQTGSGKTLSFVLPALMHIQAQEGRNQRERIPSPTALVLAPTRELAVQTQEVARVYGNVLRIQNTVLYGGSPKGAQIRALQQGAELVMATPGRLLDLVEAGYCSLSRCSFLVLDEADRMLDMGFEPQLRKILSLIRKDRQVLMWSATWPKEVERLAHDMLGRDFVQVNVGSTSGSGLLANNKIKQNIVLCSGDEEKKDKLAAVLQGIWDAVPGEENQKQMGRVIIFANKKRTVDDLYYQLRRDQWAVNALHGDKSQGERDDAIRRFKSGQVPILVATDVAARGLDVKDVQAVINFDFPDETENYVHRIGRTARGKDAEGIAYTFITKHMDGGQVKELVKIMRDANQEVSEELIAMAPKGGYGGGAKNYGRGYGYGHRSGGGGGGRGGYGGSGPKHIRF